MSKKLLGGMFLAAMAFAIPALADDARPGRYQMMILQSGSGVPPEVLILDTQEGNVWRYWIASKVGNYPGSEGVKFITKVAPGTKPGEVIYSEVFK